MLPSAEMRELKLARSHASAQRERYERDDADPDAKPWDAWEKVHTTWRSAKYGELFGLSLDRLRVSST